MVALLAAGCASSGDELPAPNPFRPDADDRRIARADAQQLYAAGRRALESGDYANALSFYSRLDANYPFTPEATQGQLESIYARYRNFEQDGAIAAADRFLRAHPRHPQVDYVLYLRGLVHFESTASDLLDLIDMDSAGRDPVDARRAFEEFARLLQTFPNSIYAPDARARMIWLRERIATHYFGIADYYRRRGAWVAAIRRAEEVFDQFRDTAVALDAVALMAEGYTAMGLDDQAQSMRAILDANDRPQEAPPASLRRNPVAPARPAAAEVPPPTAADTEETPPSAPPARRATGSTAPIASPSPAPTRASAPPAPATPAPTATPTPQPSPQRAPMRLPVMEPIIYGQESG